MSRERYEKYLPEMLMEWKEFQTLAEVEGDILEKAAEAKERVIHNQWIGTAEQNGLLRLAKIMGFSGAEQMETEKLREEILSRWSSRSPYTYFHLRDWLDSCLGEGNYTVHLEQEAYSLQLILELSVKEKKAFLERQLRKIIPANLILVVGLHTNTYKMLKKMTHGQLKGLTQGEIPFEDLENYSG